MYKKSELTPKKKEELANILDEMLTKDTQINISELSKNDLIAHIIGIQEQNVLDSTNAEDDDLAQGFSVPEVQTANKPITDDERAAQILNLNEHSPGDADWTEYVLSKLTEDEKVDKYPTCDGLRRVFELLIGEITEANTHVIQAPDINNGGRATVRYMITYVPYNSSQTIKVISDAADCYPGNTMAPFCKHPVATAATMAEGRCLRKALRLKTLSKEEMQGPKGEDAIAANELEEDQSLATDNQKNALARICDRLNIDIGKFIESEPIVGKSLQTISQKESQSLLRKLNSYQKPIENGGIAIPEEIKKGV